MHILIVPSSYPTINNPISGIFFKEQGEALAKHSNIQVGCIALNRLPLHILFDKKQTLFHYSHQKVNNINTISLIYVFVLGTWHRLTRSINLFLFKRLFKRYIKRYGKPDLIHIHFHFYGNLALWVAKKYGIPYIVTEHYTEFESGVLSQNQLSYANHIFKHSHFNLCVSREFVNLLSQLFKSKFHYLPNSINTDFFQPNADFRINKPFGFVTIGTLDDRKNQSMLIKAFAKVFKNNDSVQLTIVGDGPKLHSLQKLIQTLQMQKQISISPSLSRLAVKETLQINHAFVLCSTRETFGVVIIEAMSCGLPVVATKCGGPESIITNQKLGLLVENNNEMALAEGLKKIYNTKFDGDYIRQHIIDNFSSVVVTEQLIAIYKKVLSN